MNSVFLVTELKVLYWPNHRPHLLEDQVGQLPMDPPHFLASNKPTPQLSLLSSMLCPKPPTLADILAQPQATPARRSDRWPPSVFLHISPPSSPTHIISNPPPSHILVPNSGRDSLLDQKHHWPPELQVGHPPADLLYSLGAPQHYLQSPLLPLSPFTIFQLRWRPPGQPQATKARRPERKQNPRNETPIQQRQT